MQWLTQIIITMIEQTRAIVQEAVVVNITNADMDTIVEDADNVIVVVPEAR